MTASFGGHVSGHSRREKIKHGVLPSSQRKHVCVDCGKEFADGNKLGGHRRSHSGSIDDLKSDGSKRARLIAETGRRCSVCLLDSWMGKEIPIELDHIDGNPENGLRGNLRLICPNCHAQTDTYKGKNMGRVTNSKRAGVMKRYYGKYR